jgi:hypothetical protein
MRVCFAAFYFFAGDIGRHNNGVDMHDKGRANFEFHEEPRGSIDMRLLSIIHNAV